MIRLTKSMGMLALALYLILTGLAALFGIGFPQSGLILGLLALVAGVFILLGR